MDFKDYGFKTADVVKGLNEYYEKRKKDRDSTFIVRTGTDRIGETYYMNQDVYIKEAIDWLRDEHDIFYTPGIEVFDSTDTFDTPRYKFLSILSAELGFLTIVGPGNADKTEDAILRAVKRRNDELKNFRAQQVDEEGDAEARKEFLRKLRCELGVLYPVVGSNMKEMENDILERIVKLKEGNCPCENGVTFAKYMRKQFPKECDKWNVVPLDGGGSVHDWVQYIFGVLDEWRKRALKAEEDRAKYQGMLNTMYGASCGCDVIDVLPCYRDTCNNPKAIRERDAAKDALAELRAKVREIYRSVVDDEWDGHLSYTSALNDINEEYKRAVHNFEERTADWSEAQKEYSRYRLAVNSLLDIPSSMTDDHEQILKEIRDFADRYYELKDFRADICEVLGIDADELFGSPQQNDKYILDQVEKLKDIHVVVTHGCDHTELSKAIWEAMDRKPETLPKETARLVGEVAELARGEKLLIEFRDAVANAIGMDYPTTNQVILNNVKYIYKDRKDAYEIVSKLHDQVTELEKQVKDFTKRCDSLEDLQQDLWKFRRNAIEDLKSRGFCFRPEENETLPEIYEKLLKRYDWAYSMYKEQYRLRQMWHVRWESENERANGVQKALDREREKCRVKDISLETAKKQYEKVCGDLETAECALNGMKSKVRSLQEEKTKVISALGQDILDDCLKEEENNE